MKISTSTMELVEGICKNELFNLTKKSTHTILIHLNGKSHIWNIAIILALVCIHAATNIVNRYLNFIAKRRLWKCKKTLLVPIEFLAFLSFHSIMFMYFVFGQQLESKKAKTITRKIWKKATRIFLKINLNYTFFVCVC